MPEQCWLHLQIRLNFSIKMKLTFIQRFFIHLTFFTLFFSGLIWMLFNFYLDYETPFRFLNTWNLRLHGLAAFGFLIVFGMILSTHISFNWQVKKNRRWSGIILTAIFVALILSGYFLYYSGDDDFRSFTSYFHWIIGLICSVFFMTHFLKKLSSKVQPSIRKKVRITLGGING
jgi:hypothetical protein